MVVCEDVDEVCVMVTEGYVNFLVLFFLKAWRPFSRGGPWVAAAHSTKRPQEVGREIMPVGGLKGNP